MLAIASVVTVGGRPGAGPNVLSLTAAGPASLIGTVSLRRVAPGRVSASYPPARRVPLQVRRNAALIVLVVASILGGCTGRTFAGGAPASRPTATATKIVKSRSCVFGAELGPVDCAKVTAYVRLLELAAFYAALWAFDHPPSPGFSSWDCVAAAETGGVVAAHGSQYSSEFGMLNQAVRDRADDPASAARILAGTATEGEERRAAWREDLAFGPTAWGALTVAKCAI